MPKKGAAHNFHGRFYTKGPGKNSHDAQRIPYFQSNTSILRSNEFPGDRLIWLESYRCDNTERKDRETVSGHAATSQVSEYVVGLGIKCKEC